MKIKVLFVILLAIMLVTPVFAFIHPEVPEEPVTPCNTFGVKIEDAWCYSYAYAMEFHEPEDNYCDTFEVQVLAVNVTDLYGFEYKLHWDSTYFNLIGIAIEQVWADQLVALNKTDSSWHKLVAVAKAPSPGVNDPDGGILLCTYTFHIRNDVCWPQGMVQGGFWIDEYKMSDSCTGDLDPCDPINAYWKFFAKEPEVYIEPKEDINCVVGEEVTYQVWVHNITKMKSIHFDLRWKGNEVDNPYETVWLRILSLTEVVINEEWLPEDNRTDTITIFNDPANITSYVVVDIVMECTYPLINGTFKVCDLIFEKMDPWWCGRQPRYDIDTETHIMAPDNATTPLWFNRGWIDVMCPELKYIDFGDYPLLYADLSDPDHDWKHSLYFASYNEAKFTFMPVPGDLTGDGIVNIKDLTAIAAKYGLTLAGAVTWPEFFAVYYYDFNGDGVIDIFDIIVVSKNWERTCPF